MDNTLLATAQALAVSVNGERRLLVDDEGRAASMRLSQMIAIWGYGEQKIAVAINEQLVFRQDYEHTLLRGGERIDIVSPIQGG